MKIPVFRQLESIDCGPTCIRIISAYYGKNYSLKYIKELCSITRSGVSILDIIDCCQKIGLYALSAKVTYQEISDMPLPAIVYWRQEHFVVIYKISVKKGHKYFHLIDPAFGKIKINDKEFKTSFIGTKTYGLAILIEPLADFLSTNIEPHLKSPYKGLIILLKETIIQYKKSFIGALILMLLAMIGDWAIPIIFQKTVDDGIMSKDIKLIWILLLSQAAFFGGYIISSCFTEVILTKLGFKIGIDYIAKYLMKLIRLPMSFFDTRLNTDFIQHLEDQSRIKNFLTNTLSSSVFTILTLLSFSVILAYYNYKIFLIFFLFSLLSILWMSIFMKKRKILDYSFFSIHSEYKNNIYELVNGMTEIKINNAEYIRIKEWRKIQDNTNIVELKSLYLNYYISFGMQFLGRFKDIIIVGLCAFLVIKDQMSLGVMMSVNYIMGRLTSPLNEILNFVRSYQDVRISFNRLNEVYDRPSEEQYNSPSLPNLILQGLNLKNVYFKYEGGNNPYVLEDICLFIPKGKITAIVGKSGSGKTTLLKLLLSFYYPQKGEIYLDHFKMSELNMIEWRKRCGVVMQDGYIFSGSIAENIAMADEHINWDKLMMAAQCSCLDEFVERLPMKYYTKIGKKGLELSGGQKQRIFIARAIYKNPDFIFFDEATSFLDADNERKIMINLKEFYKHKTVVIIAHRLSTVKDADNIVYLDKGRIIEQGNHRQLSELKGKYFTLVKNQLEMGK